MTLRPFFSYYGGKWSLAKRYPEPEHDTIIEPFAGSAGYSLHHYSRNVILIEKNPKVAAIWRYLISVDPQRILDLPDVDERGVDALDVTAVEKWLIGFWLNAATTNPCRTMSRWAIDCSEGKYHSKNFWGQRVRERIANQVPHIRHWRVIEDDYKIAAPVTATWFVDPPYNNSAGLHYPCGPRDIDFVELGKWCLRRRGLVIVCENDGADWLPFRTLARTAGCTGKQGRRRSSEVVYIQGRTRGQVDMFMEGP